MRHLDHTHETVAEARTCEATRRGTAPITAAATARTEISARLMRQHTTSAILANISGMAYRPTTPQAAQRQDAKYARVNRTAPAPRSREAVASAKAAPAVPGYVARPAHPNRISFAKKLIEERATDLISFAADQVMMDLLAGNLISGDEIGLLIGDLLAAPKADRAGTRPAQPAPQAQRRQDGPSLRDLAAGLEDKGYYALRGDDQIHYYRITRSAKGYVKVQEKAGPELYPVDYRRSIEVVRMIAEDAQAALNLFADTLEKCYRCSTDLTDPISRAARMGPDCRAK